MRSGTWALALALAATLALPACNRNKDPELMNIRSQTRAPDEFAILPVKPLELPEDIASLPDPTPGGTNRTDLTPKADAVAALGGNPAAVTPTGQVTRDGGLVTYASRYGVSSEIRTVLAAEDLEYRRRNDGRLLERIFNVNVYYRAYERQSLDQHAELERWRRAGARNVGAPPNPEER